MHSTSRLAYAWDDETFDEFQAEVCLDASAGKKGSVTFRVFLYDNQQKNWHQAFKSPVVRGGDAPVPIRLPLEGAQN